MTVFVKTMSGKIRPLQVDSHSTTVFDLKKTIEEEEGIQAEHQRMIYSGHELNQENMTLGEYNIKPDSAIYLILRLYGGKYNNTT
ncbi:ubiquitin-related domain-containing protein [Cokeromyces recurvatus]|uniref:ubiquitin-related domain-containing protein n=1 Tax=Cokeromyces recurvatus TaxID=90255 RepID=UPI0022200164|nr:ubiquitin-related domain-containing protein [Cokeromyces recurvatus]KAI7901505.1 ubiquitin-related domain-containing protein [Cokeromyces recurvatus]